MSNIRLFDAKKADPFKKQYQLLCADLFAAMTKSKYKELREVLQALMQHSSAEFMKVIQDLQKEKNGLEYYIPDYRNPQKLTSFKLPFKRWSGGIFGVGKTLRKILTEKSPQLLSLKKYENEYKVLSEADRLLNKAKDFKENNLKELWINLTNIKLKLEDFIDPRIKNNILSSYYHFVIVKLTEIYFASTIQGLSHKSISVNFAHMLTVLVHGDEEMIIDTLMNNGITSSFTLIKECHSHIFREKSHNHFDDVVNFMEYKKNSDKFRHTYFELIPLFIRKCHEHQEALIIQEYSISDKELMVVEKETIIEKYLHDHHSISKNIFKNLNLNEYVFLYFEDHLIREEPVLPDFSEYCKQFDRYLPCVAKKGI